MPDFEIKIDAAAIQREVTQAVLDSAIGESLKKTLTELAGKWRVESYWDNSLSKIVESEIQQMITSAVREKLGPVLKKNVDRLLTEEFLNQAADAAISRISF